MSELILHHYDFSNYAEKVRLALGYKGLAWSSVIIPPVAPKPELTPLTGGYRRTPVLQIGADIYCDTRLILRELERRYPQPALFPLAFAAQAHTIAFWAENELFRPVSLYVSGSNPEAFPLTLQADRARMRGLPPPDATAMRNAARRNGRFGARADPDDRSHADRRPRLDHGSSPDDRGFRHLSRSLVHHRAHATFGK